MSCTLSLLGEYFCALLAVSCSFCWMMCFEIPTRRFCTSRLTLVQLWHSEIGTISEIYLLSLALVTLWTRLASILKQLHFLHLQHQTLLSFFLLTWSTVPFKLKSKLSSFRSNRISVFQNRSLIGSSKVEFHSWSFSWMKGYHIDWSVRLVYINQVHLWLDNTTSGARVLSAINSRDWYNPVLHSNLYDNPFLPRF